MQPLVKSRENHEVTRGLQGQCETLLSACGPLPNRSPPTMLHIQGALSRVKRSNSQLKVRIVAVADWRTEVQISVSFIGNPRVLLGRGGGALRRFCGRGVVGGLSAVGRHLHTWRGWVSIQ